MKSIFDEHLLDILVPGAPGHDDPEALRAVIETIRITKTKTFAGLVGATRELGELRRQVKDLTNETQKQKHTLELLNEVLQHHHGDK